MRPALISLALLLLGAGCASSDQWDRVTPTVERFLALGESGDSVAAARLTTRPDPVVRLFALRRLDPSRLAAAAAGIRLTGGGIANDTARAFYGFAHEGGEETVTIGLERRGRAWMIYYVGFSGDD